MKKRSLVAALAMLMVSAIVLTSSTYAWFATSSSAKVETISAKISNNDGSLTVQATGDYAASGAVKKTILTAADFSGVAENLTPVSVYLDNGAFKAGKVAYNAADFQTYEDAVNKEYLTYQFTAEYVAGASAGATINIKPTFTTESEFCYGLVAITTGGTTTYYAYTASGSYTAVKGLNGTVVDNGNSIIDSADTNYQAATMVESPLSGATNATSGQSVKLMDVEANTTGKAVVDVYVWAEGQDENCSGNISSASSYFNFDLEVAA